MELKFENEIWKDIKGFENHYQVSNYGRVRSMTKKVNTGMYNQEYAIKKGKIIKPSSYRGYYLLTLSKENKRITKPIHRLVAQTFIPNPNNLPQVNHKNGVKTDNRVENLEWVSCKENVRHAWQTGLISETNIKKKLKVMRLSRMKPIAQYKNGILVEKFDSLQQAEEKTKIGHKNISSVIRGRSKTAGGYEWKLLQGE